MQSHAKTSMLQEFPALEALKARDEAAWEVAFQHLWPIALRSASASNAFLLPSEVEEVASDAIIELVPRIRALATENDAKALITIIARRRAISCARKKSAAKRQLPFDFSADDSTTSSASDLTDMDRCEILLLLREALDRLDPTTRLLLMEKHAHGFTYDEISERHSIPVGTLCPKITRALRIVQEHLRQLPAPMKELTQYLR